MQLLFARNIALAARLSSSLKLIFLAAVAILVTGCDSDSPDNNKISPPPIVTATIVPVDVDNIVPVAMDTIIVPLPLTFSMAQAWGADIDSKVKHIPVQATSDTFLIPQSVTEDGKYLLATSNPSASSDGSNDFRSKVVMIDIASGQSIDITSMPDDKNQQYGVESDGDWIAWTQEAGQLSGIYAYKIADGSTRTVAEGDNKANIYSTVLLSHGKLIWNETELAGDAGKQDSVKMMDMATGQVTTLYEEGAAQQLSWPYVLLAQVPVRANGEPPISLFNLQDGSKRAIDKPIGFSHLDLYGNMLAWITLDSRHVFLGDLDGTFEQEIATAQGGSTLEWLSLNDRLVAWSGNSSPMVWDLKQKRLVTIPPVNVIFVRDRTLLWTDPGAPFQINLLDTTLLP